MIQEVNDVLNAVLEERGADGRTVYARVASLPPDGWTLELECSDASVADAVVARLDLAGDDARRLRVTRLPGTDVPPALLVTSSVADVRRTPSHVSELVSQAVMGDIAAPLKAEGEWFLVRTDDGYLGWVRSWHVAETTPERGAAFARRAGHRVAANHAPVYAEASDDALPVADLVVGTPLVVAPPRSRAWLEAELPDGRMGFLRRKHVEKRAAARTPSREQLAATGLRFLGIPYLWGGSTPQGFDCSGLIQRVFRLHGLVLPRDSDQQARYGREKQPRGLDDIATGDLLFFGRVPERITHVALALPERMFLHAYGQVRVNSIDPAHPLFEPNLVRDWRLTRDPLS